jgi:hypothetical protein
MSRIKKWKASLGPFGFLADVVAIAQTNWGLVISLVVAVGASIWKSAFEVATNPHFQVAVAVFFVTLWTFTAVSILRQMHTGIKIKPVLDYAHSIVLDGNQLAFDRNAKKTDFAIQYGINVRNVSNGPICVEVHDYRVIINGRTIPDSNLIKLILPRLGAKGIVSGAFTRDAIKERAEGTATLTLHYGPLDGPAVRKYVLKMALSFVVQPGGDLGVAQHIISEDDTPI